MNKFLQVLSFVMALTALTFSIYNGSFSDRHVSSDDFMYYTWERADSLGGDTIVTVSKKQVHAAITNLNARTPNHDALVEIFSPWAINVLNDLVVQLELENEEGNRYLTYHQYVDVLEKRKLAQQEAERKASEDKARAERLAKENEELKQKLKDVEGEKQ